MNRTRHDGPLIVGAGLAGLSAALEAAKAGAKVLVVTPEPLLNACSSAWAQGGMAAALVVLTIQPEAIVTPGFQMSFAATAALVALVEAWPSRLREISAPLPILIVQRGGAWLG